MSHVAVVEADENDWDLGGVTILTRAELSGIQGRLCKQKAECRAVHTKWPVGLVDED